MMKNLNVIDPMGAVENPKPFKGVMRRLGRGVSDRAGPSSVDEMAPLSEDFRRDSEMDAGDLFGSYTSTESDPSELRFGFYDSTCPSARSIVLQVVAKHWSLNQTVTAALLRMQFHDCFVNGCDASLLIDSTTEKPSEKIAGPNASVRGFEIIDEAKREIELVCPKTVSCADIVTIATRDYFFFAGGPRFRVQLGRRDGFRSNPSNVNLPGPTITVAASIKAFQAKGLNVRDMVTLIGGGHSVGVAHCSLFRDRLRDPAMDPTLKARLRKTCRGPNDPSVFLDQGTPFRVDYAIYRQIKSQKGILRIDQNLALHGSTSGIVSRFASDRRLFGKRFVEAMHKMGAIGVLTGDSGEIRTNCRAFNN